MLYVCIDDICMYNMYIYIYLYLHSQTHQTQRLFHPWPRQVAGLLARNAVKLRTSGAPPSRPPSLGEAAEMHRSRRGTKALTCCMNLYSICIILCICAIYTYMCIIVRYDHHDFVFIYAYIYTDPEFRQMSPRMGLGTKTELSKKGFAATRCYCQLVSLFLANAVLGTVGRECVKKSKIRNPKYYTGVLCSKSCWTLPGLVYQDGAILADLFAEAGSFVVCGWVLFRSCKFVGFLLGPEVGVELFAYAPSASLPWIDAVWTRVF